MPLKALIIVAGTVIASAVTALPVLAPGGLADGRQVAPAPAANEPVAAKGDRLRVLEPACDRGVPSAACADIYGITEGPQPMLTVGRRIGPATTVLIRLPVSQFAQGQTRAIAAD